MFWHVYENVGCMVTLFRNTIIQGVKKYNQNYSNSQQQENNIKIPDFWRDKHAHFLL